MKKWIQGIILAAGKSSRFQTDQSKLLHTLCGQEMIVYGTKVLVEQNIAPLIVIGHQKETIQECLKKYDLPSLTFIEQAEQKGTGHAVLITESFWDAENLLIMNGDMPLINSDIIQSLLTHHTNSQAVITFAITHNPDPDLQGYGRIVKNEQTKKIEIVEARHFKGDPTIYCCVNAGLYLMRTEFVREALHKLSSDSESGEIYITDLIARASQENLKIETLNVPFDRVRGINTLKELWTAEHIKRSELISYWMSKGVRFSAAQNVHVDVDVTIGANSFIGAGALLIKGTKIGQNCIVEAFTFMSNTIMEDGAKVLQHCVIEDSSIAAKALVGPFAHVHNKSHIQRGAVVGNFVEVSRSEIGTLSKVKHLSYIGDAQVGSTVNIGAGTITCNYNGYTKNVTTIKNNASIGSNTSLVAPIIIGESAVTAAGSVITESVPDRALALARSRQINKKEYVEILKEKYDPNYKRVTPFNAAIKSNSLISEEK